jgi:hypothetical protein
MTNISLDQNAISQLQLAGGLVGITDASGKFVGYFQPSQAPFPTGSWECPFSDEELARREAVPGGRPLVDILTDLKKKQ